MIVARWSRWLGFGFVHGGERERETEEEGREKRIRDRRLFFWLYILVDNIYYFNK